jgi:DNA-directed RNA polymerase delta subunit
LPKHLLISNAFGKGDAAMQSIAMQFYASPNYGYLKHLAAVCLPSSTIRLHAVRNCLVYYGLSLQETFIMADNESSIRQTLEFFLAERAKKMEEIKRLDLTIMQLRQVLGEPFDAEPIETPGPALPTNSSITSPTPKTAGGRVSVRADEFFGLQYSDAARNYLRKVGHAVSLEELLDALRNGGCKVGGTDPKRVLYISLVRNTRDFVPTGNGFVGLREFYPNLPKTKAAVNGKKTKRKKSKRKSQRSKTAVPADDRTESDGGAKLRSAISDIMQSGEFMDGKEILKKVQEHLGTKVTPITVYGMLRSKGLFEKNSEGKYRVLSQA